MANSNERDRIQNLWQQQSSESFRMSPEEIRRRVKGMEKNLRVKTCVGIAACALVVVGAIWWLTIFEDRLQQVGSLLTIAGVAYLAWQLRRATSSAGFDLAHAAASGGMESTAFYRAALDRMRDFHRGGGFWLRLAIFVPGPVMFMVGFAHAHPEVGKTIRIEGLVMVALLIAAIPLNLWLGSRYARRIAELDQLRKEA
ncbi:MAG TPA: hypothetical protein VFV19_13740 [Candidatus Polarisedimenticolaceae bacterium]|nr:hypothetical protein [Candidatus Polarisedimenticolaceae bacterium]